MTKILFIKSSPRGSASVSSQLGEELVNQLRERYPDAELKVRDLAADPVPHINPEFSSGTFTPPDKRSPAQQEALDLSDSLLDEVMQADHVVVSAAMINFAIPSTLKAWIDQILRVGVSFHYTENGPEGLLKGKQLYLVLARGSAYGPERRDWDFQLSYLEKIFQFIGMDQQTHILAEATLAPEEVAAANLEKARRQISAIGEPARGRAYNFS